MRGWGLTESKALLLACAMAGGFLAMSITLVFVPGLMLANLKAAISVNHAGLPDFLDSLIVQASLYGREYFWGGLIVVMLLLGDKTTKRAGVMLTGIVLVGFILGEASKLAFSVPRPSVFFGTVVGTEGIFPSDALTLRVPLDQNSSFPSGHALIVSLGATYLLFKLRRKWLAGLLLVETAVVCISRLYVGVHYPADVVGGIALGAAIALAGVWADSKSPGLLADKVADALLRILKFGRLSL